MWLVRQDKKGHVLEDVHIALVQAVERLVSAGAQGGLGAVAFPMLFEKRNKCPVVKTAERKVEECRYDHG